MTATPTVPGAINVPVLTGAEIVEIATGGPQYAQTTTAAIAALSGNGLTQDILNTAITTVGNGTLTASAMLGGLITRTGPVAAYTDTTASAAQIVTAIGSFNSGATFNVIIKNATAFVQTLSAGANVTLPVTVLVGPFQEAEYYGVIGGTAAAPTVTLGHLLTTSISLSPSISNPSAVVLSTVGAGTILANAFTAGGTARTGAQSSTPFTDTTDLAATIIAANPGLVGKIGSSVRYEYANLTNALATIVGGTGVTVSQPGNGLAASAIVPAGFTAAFNLTYTAAGTITLVAIALSSGSDLSVSQITRCGTQVDVTSSAVLVNVTGLVQSVIAGTYYFEIDLTGTSGASTGGGWKLAFNYTTAVLSALNATGVLFSAAAFIATGSTTTTTTQTTIVGSTSASVAITAGRIVGTMVVTTGGTVQLQFAQNNSSSGASSIFVGSTMRFIRIG